MFFSIEECIDLYDINVKSVRTKLEDSIRYHTSFLPDKDIDLSNDILQRINILKISKINQ